jgi:iron complex outermembrane receptor protein
MFRATRFLQLQFIFSLSSLGILFAQNGEEASDDFDLEDMLNTKISASAKYEQRANEAPSSVTIITSEDIEQFGYRGLEDILPRLRGFYLSGDLNTSYLGVRGFGRPTDYNNRILFLVNGHSVNENVFGAAVFDGSMGMSMDSIERIEIVRGPGSVLYGTGALFAVINIITKEGRTLQGIRASAQAGSFGAKQGALVFGQEFDQDLGLQVSALWGDINGADRYFVEYDDPATNNGIANNLDWERYYGLQGTVRRRGLTLQALWGSRDAGVPTGPFGVVFNNPSCQFNGQRGFVDLKYDLSLGRAKSLMMRGSYDYFHYAGSYPYEFDGLVVNNNDAADGRWLAAESQFRWDVGASNRLSLGMEFQKHARSQYRMWYAGEVLVNEDSPYHVISAYAQNELQIVDNLALTLGIRSDKFSNLKSTFTPRAAVVYNPLPASALKLLYGRAYRKPNTFEVNSEDPISGYKSNYFLGREEIRTVELVWEQKFWRRFFGTISLYDYEMDDLIEQVIDPVDSLVQHQNIGGVRARGIEMELSIHPRRGLHGYLNYTFQEAENTDSQLPLSNSPTHMIKLGLWYPVFKSLEMAAECRYESERLTLHETTTDPFFVVNVKLATQQLFNHARLVLSIRNILDTDYQTPVGLEFRQAAITQNGRDITLRLELRN